MKKVLMGLLAASMLSGAPIAISTSVMAIEYNAAYCNANVGALPNPQWSWSISTQTGPEQTSVEVGDVFYSGNSGNGTADVTTTVSQTVTVVCTALNPSGNPNTEKSGSVDAGTVIISQNTENLQVCFQSPNKTDLIDGCQSAGN